MRLKPGAIPLYKRASLFDHTIGFVLCALYVALLMVTERDLGMARDEGMYVEAADNYAQWLQLLWHDAHTAVTQNAVDHYFRVNHEHPPLMKLLFGVGALAQQAWHVFSRDSLAYRFAGMLSAGLLLWVIYVFGARLYGRTAGLFAALVYALLPRPFYHAHLDAFDVPITLAITCVTYAYHRSLTQRRWAFGAGIAFGFALLVKHNSWILPGIFALHFAWLALVERRARSVTETRAILLVPYGILAMLVFGPLIFLSGWPWLWFDTLARLRAYAAFHLHHDYYNMEYFGLNYFWPPFPMSYAWVMTLFTVPLTTLTLACSGLVIEITRTVGQLRNLLAKLPSFPTHDATQATVLLLGSWLAPLVLISIPSTPIFGGTKHWFPAYPFLALLAGRAFQLLRDWLRGKAPARWGKQRLRIVSTCAALLLAPAAVETAHSHPFGLSYYTVAAGGVPGAATLGMNRQFWGFTTQSLVPFFKRALPHGGSVYICDTIWTAWQMLSRNGLLPADIRANGDIATADYAIVQHELHFLEVDTQIWTTYGNVRPSYVLRYDGVPIISVYKNPHGSQH